MREGVGDLVGVVKECHRVGESQGYQSVGGPQGTQDVDWKRVYRELTSIIFRIKAMVVAGNKLLRP